MPLLQSMEGKYYDVPDDQAASFEVPREKVKEMLTKAGPPPQKGPGGQRPQGPMGGPPGGGAPVIIQVLPNGVHGPASGPPPGSPASKPPGAGEDDEVDPYWWIWRNVHIGPYWQNTWYNW